MRKHWMINGGMLIEAIYLDQQLHAVTASLQGVDGARVNVPLADLSVGTLVRVSELVHADIRVGS